MRFQRYEKPTVITLVCGRQVTVISAAIIKYLWGYTGDADFIVGGVTADLKRVYFDG